MINHDDALTQLRTFGLLVDAVEVDGRLHRCKVEDGGHEKRGWYILHRWRAGNGDEYAVGTFGTWRGNEQNTQKIELRRTALTRDELVALKQRIAEDRKHAAAAREREADQAARRAAAMWAKGLNTPPDGAEVDYLERKAVKSWGLRYTTSGCLILPLMDAGGDVRGLQFILPRNHPFRKKTGRDKQYWPGGLTKQGTWYQIGSLAQAAVCLVVEGYATGASVHEATGLPVAVALDAGNLLHVARALRKKGVRHILLCADDDYLTEGNPGCTAASAAALAVGGAWLKPEFPADRDGKKLTDFNDLQLFPSGGLALVRQQIDAKLEALGWRGARSVSARSLPDGGGGTAMPAQLSVDEAALRYACIYGMGGDVLFDAVERTIVHKKDVLNLLPRHGWELLKQQWRVVRANEVGFDPTERDPAIKCNLFGGWPTVPQAGSCERLLELLRYLCSREINASVIYEWMLNWLAYPIQHPGAKMHCAIVVHGGQGTGKSRFFEAYGQIYGPYHRVLGQEALEDKFNADWASKKLFIIGDEVLARHEMFHIKNRLKGFITGATVRVNPKNVAAHTERNHMNIVFLSNDSMPLALEIDDRRHLVIRTPPKLPEGFFTALDREIDAGGIAALHQFLLDRDLGDFRPWTKPPLTDAKEDLIELSAGSEERFIAEWIDGRLETPDGDVLPVIPCGSLQLFRHYVRYVNAHGERGARNSTQLLARIRALPGWEASRNGVTTRTSLRPEDRGTRKHRKMVVPSVDAMHGARLRCGVDYAARWGELQRDKFDSQTDWLTACFFAWDRLATNE